MMGWRPWVALPVLLLLVYAGARPIGEAPALGPLIDPAHGIWALEREQVRPGSEHVEVPGLDSVVSIRYDRRGVPHITAALEHDAYRALGYVVARDRLFQLELQTRMASGTLTELAGARALDVDRRTRALGMPRAAERKLAALDSSDPGYRAMRAYADGVNAWIDGMSGQQLPIEYRLLGRRPARWTPINSVHLLNQMARTLSYGEDELRHLGAAARVGQPAADALFPYNSPIQEPIQPNGQGAPRFALRRLPPPGAPSELSTQPVQSGAAGDDLDGERGRLGEAVGSNNWAVAPSRTAHGHALLAGDPHLDLTLPSIWYEARLEVPGRLDVYGVTIPGAPTIIIGFNRDVAWTFTNTQADVVDFYAERVDDQRTPSRYMLDGAWTPLELRVERYRDPDGAVIATDTIRYSHRGPLQRWARGWLSMRWTLFEPSGEHATFIAATRARTVAEWMSAMSAYVAPAQNMLVADRAGTIAIRSTGAYPLRPGDGRGDVIRDGSTRASDWTGMWPIASYPQAVNPAQGFLASANQQPIDPAVNPTYLGADWYPPWRAIRINQLLRQDASVTSDAMRRYQTDPGSVRADIVVPYFVAAARSPGAPDSVARAAALLAEWDRRYTTDNERAVLFEYAMDALALEVWDELRVPNAAGFGPARRPSDAVLVELLADSASAWWDVVATSSAVERRDEVLRRSLLSGYSRALATHGDPAKGGWRWSGIQRVNVRHLLGLPAFAAPAVPALGGPATLSPSSGNGSFGASWRMVVELGPAVRAWATYPGGQSGNPMSNRYTDRLEVWARGELEELIVPPRGEVLPASQTRGMLILEPAR